jgi:heat shock protein HslJ
MKRLMRVSVLAYACGVLLTASACAGAGESQDPTTLEGVEWHLVESSISSADLGAAGITATFASGTISGFSGVNQYSGGYSAEADGAFSAGPLAGTMMAGPEPLMNAESAYLKLLEDAEEFSVEEDRLTLTTGDGSTLAFEAAKAVELPGTTWTVTGFNNGKQAVTSPIIDSELTLEFGTDGQVSGSSGVNTFSGSFTATDDAIEIGPLASTMMAGEPELMEQESQYVAALEASVSWKVVNGMLEMRDAEGATQVNGAPAGTP